MIEELATVVSVNDFNIVVTSNIKSACSGCSQADKCGSGQVAKAFPQKQLMLNIVSDLSVKVGDNVIIGISEKCLLNSAWQVYLWPLIGLISFSGLGQWLIEQLILPHELYAIALGGIGGYIGYLFASHQQKSINNQTLLMPKLVRILTEKIKITEITH